MVECTYYSRITILLVHVVDPLSYIMMTHCLHVAGNLPIKNFSTFVARQPYNIYNNMQVI